jgi:hypothetical protein
MTATRFARSTTTPPRARRHEPETLPPPPRALEQLDETSLRTANLMTSARWKARGGEQ